MIQELSQKYLLNTLISLHDTHLGTVMVGLICLYNNVGVILYIYTEVIMQVSVIRWKV